MPAKRSFEEWVLLINQQNPSFFENNILIESESIEAGKLYAKCKVCGYERQQASKSILKGCGCKKCSSVYAGMRNRLATGEWVTKVLERHPDNFAKYDYSDTSYEKANTKVSILCKTCSKMFNQTPNDHFSGKGCPHCCNRITTTETFIERVIKRFPENSLLFDYSKVDYISDTTPIIIGCKTCNNDFLQKPTKHYQGHGCNLHNGNTGGFRSDSSGYLYVVEWEHNEDKFLKVGISTKSPSSRAMVQKSQTTSDMKYRVIYKTYSKNGSEIMSLERQVLNHFKESSRYVDRLIFPDGWTETFPFQLKDKIINYIKELLDE